jgi:hypothetical protein
VLAPWGKCAASAAIQDVSYCSVKTSLLLMIILTVILIVPFPNPTIYRNRIGRPVVDPIHAIVDSYAYKAVSEICLLSRVPYFSRC